MDQVSEPGLAGPRLTAEEDCRVLGGDPPDLLHQAIVLDRGIVEDRVGIAGKPWGRRGGQRGRELGLADSSHQGGESGMPGPDGQDIDKVRESTQVERTTRRRFEAFFSCAAFRR